MVWLGLGTETTLLRLGYLCCHGDNNSCLVKPEITNFMASWGQRKQAVDSTLLSHHHLSGYGELLSKWLLIYNSS